MVGHERRFVTGTAHRHSKRIRMRVSELPDVNVQGIVFRVPGVKSKCF